LMVKMFLWEKLMQTTNRAFHFLIVDKAVENAVDSRFPVEGVMRKAQAITTVVGDTRPWFLDLRQFESSCCFSIVVELVSDNRAWGVVVVIVIVRNTRGRGCRKMISRNMRGM